MYTGVDFKVKTVVLDAKRVKLSIWVSEEDNLLSLHYVSVNPIPSWLDEEGLAVMPGIVLASLTSQNHFLALACKTTVSNQMAGTILP